MKRPSMEVSPEEIQRQEDDLEKRKAAIAREIHRKDQIQRELDAYEEGFKEGRQQGKEEVILTMLKNQFPIKEIVDITNLSIEEVQRIINHSVTK